MLVRACFAVAWAILLAAIAFAELVLVNDDGDTAFLAVQIALILGPAILVAGFVVWLGTEIEAEEAAPDSD